MNFKGEQAISRPTRATGRTVLIVSLTLFLFKLGWIETADASIVGLRFAEGKFETIATGILGLALLAHLVQWTGDLFSYQAWNINGRKMGAPRWGTSKDQLDGFFYDLEVSLNRIQDPTNEQENLDLTGLQRNLSLLTNSLSRYRRFMLFYFYIWHMAVPILAAVVTLAWPQSA